MYLDKSITFESYSFWAHRAREAEKHFTTPNQLTQVGKVLMGKKIRSDETTTSPAGSAIEMEKTGKTETPPVADGAGDSRFGIHETEWETAQRATRTATWGTVFYRTDPSAF